MKKQKRYLLFGLILALVQFSCNDENVVTYELKTLPKSVFPNETFALEVSPATVGWTFSSKNNNIATVTDSGVVTTHYTGSTMLYARHTASGSVDSVQVTVKPRITNYSEPCLTFYSSKSTIKAKETQFELTYESPTYLAYEKPIDIGYTYWCQYYFNSGKYYFSYMEFQIWLKNQILSQISERYLFIREKESSHYNTEFMDRYYINPDSSVIVTVAQSLELGYSDYLLVFYHPYTEQSLEIIKKDSARCFFNFYNDYLEE